MSDAVALHGDLAPRTAMRRLAPFAEAVAQADILDELLGAAIDLSEKTGNTAAYSDLNGNDPFHWDTAVGLLAALRLTFGAAGLAAAGLTGMGTADGSKEQYSMPSETDMAAWRTDLAVAVSRLSFVAARRQPALKSFSLSAVGQRVRRPLGGGIFAPGGLLSIDDIVSDLTNSCEVLGGYGAAIYGGAPGEAFGEDGF